MNEATGCPECGTTMQNEGDYYTCPACGHRGEQGALELPGVMRKLSLFSGIGGIDLAAEWAGIETVAFCEREPFPRRVLEKHWPGRPIYDDVRTLTREKLEEDGIIGPTRTIDLISAGYPCQPFSSAGKRKGKDDDRHLWPEVARLLEEIRPRWFLGENVAGHITLGLDDVLSELESIGYAAQAFVIPAAAVGAPHRRDRVFVLGYAERIGCAGESRGRTEQESENGHLRVEARILVDTNSQRLQKRGRSEWGEGEKETGSGLDTEFERPSETLADSDNERMERSENAGETFGDGSERGNEHAGRCGSNIDRGTIESRMGRMSDGVSARIHGHRWPAGLGKPQYEWEPKRVATGVKHRVGRLKALGNSVNPLQVYPILAAIKAINDELEGCS